jgi:hypothetical protein
MISKPSCSATRRSPAACSGDHLLDFIGRQILARPPGLIGLTDRRWIVTLLPISMFGEAE